MFKGRPKRKRWWASGKAVRRHAATGNRGWRMVVGPGLGEGARAPLG